MRRTAAAGLVLSILLLAACSDSTLPPMPTPASRPLISTAPTGSLDAQITSLIQTLFPTGLDTAASARWTALKAKYADGQTKASQLAVAKKMLVDLTTWVEQKTPQMNTPGNGLSQQAAAAQLVLYMADYVYFGPGFTPQTFPPGADATVGIVSPTTATTIVTPTTRAGVSLGAGSVDDQTIIVVRQNPTYYPANCTGPMSTKYCQYPQFYQFDEFPHVRLNKVAHFSVCHVKGDSPRAPLADHNRFRLAHTLPANPADYTPGATQVDGIEILPLIHQSFVNCDASDVYVPPPSQNRIGLMLWRGRRMLRDLASAAGKLVSPEAALAIDQGGGGDALSFSDFNDVDPQSQPDNAVQNVSAPSSAAVGTAITASFTVTNVGTASSSATVDTVQLVPAAGPPVTLAAGAIPALVPQQSTGTLSQQVTIPQTTAPGSYTLRVIVAPNTGLAELSTANNSASVPIAILSPGPNLVVLNDVNIFDDDAGADANNQQFFRNLVAFNNGGPRGTQTGVLWYQGHAPLLTIAPSNTYPYQFQTLQSTLSAAGYTFTYGAPDLTTLDPSYKVLILDMPTTSFSSAEVSAIAQFALDGGRVVYVGEHDGVYQPYYPVENALLAGVGSTMTAVGGQYDCGYNVMPASSLPANPLNAGMTDMSIACSAAVSLGATDHSFLLDSQGQHVLGAATTLTAPVIANLAPRPGVSASLIPRRQPPAMVPGQDPFTGGTRRMSRTHR